MSQTVLPFKLESTAEQLTSHAGLALMGEYLASLGFSGLVDRLLPAPGSAQGYVPSAYVTPLVLMLTGGGRSLEDLRVLRSDRGWQLLLKLDGIPSSDACGDWLRRMGDPDVGAVGLEGLARVRRHLLARHLHRETRSDYTLDIDATQIVAEKYTAQTTYKGEKGYMPLVGHLAENGLVVHEVFRNGNASPAAGNLEFIQACDDQMPKGKHITAIRADSAAYQASIFNWCEQTDKVFAIGADLDASVKAAIRQVPESDWVPYRDGQIAETVHCMNKTTHAFRLIVMRRPKQADLFDAAKDGYHYHAIASNREHEDATTTHTWYAKRGDTSENNIKELKIGFGMERMPCGQTHANAIFFRLGSIAYNLTLGFKQHALDTTDHRRQVQTLRWQLFATPGKIIRHAGGLCLKIATHLIDRFTRIRQRIAQCALTDPPPLPA